MSAVKGFLVSQRADFISLRELLEAMTKSGDGCSLAEAASVLSQILEFEGVSNPWFSYTATKGLQPFVHASRGQSRPNALLAYTANNDKLEEDPFDDIPF